MQSFLIEMCPFLFGLIVLTVLLLDHSAYPGPCKWLVHLQSSTSEGFECLEQRRCGDVRWIGSVGLHSVTNNGRK